MTCKVQISRRAYKQLLKLPMSIQGLADVALTDLRNEGKNPRGWDTLKTNEDEYRLRLNYRYRMRYRVLNKTTIEIEIFFVGHRREAYR
jgi:mRNA-degrading endonuclease RelE of RelBE toxin-antitoxin system